jgi:hypothetical protein
MHALIEKTTRDGRQVYWTGEDWILTSVVGWRDAAKFASHEDAAYELEQHADENAFAHATVIDID